ncbi:hypothetical protein HWV62_27007 [Athelia sp. TMB]|nr:hypothetical protein HWV62_27007 [Athelia sp. TMB]
MRVTKPSGASEYVYDFPMPAAGRRSPPASPTHLRKTQQRAPAPAPAPRITYHTPHFSSSHKYAPASRAAEDSRLLDPSYSNLPASGSSGSSPLSVFVDHAGDMHDPDYRPFPAVKPKWERGYDEDEEEEEEPAANRRLSAYAYRPSYSTSTYAPYTPTRYAYDASPASYESHALPEDEESPFEEKEKRASVVKRYRRRGSKNGSDEKTGFVAAAAPAPSGADDWTYVAPLPPIEPAADRSPRPTCGEGLRREWHAMTLRLRFSVFRTKRKLCRRLGNG